MSANYDQLKAFRDKLSKVTDTQKDQFMEDCLRELAARLLAKVIKRTPVGVYHKGSGKTGGTLRRGWTGGEKNNALNYAENLNVNHSGDIYTIEIINDVEYAPYVEYGHRTRGGNGWVSGRFMLTISEKEIREAAPAILEAKIEKWLVGLLK